jgi:competence protein ComEA
LRHKILHLGEEEKVSKRGLSIFKSVSLVFALMVLLSTGSVFAQDGILNFNKASVEVLMANEDLELDGEIASAIVAYREKNGAFKKPADLLKVPGIDQDLIDDINPIMKDGDLVYDPDAEQPGMKAY